MQTWTELNRTFSNRMILTGIVGLFSFFSLKSLFSYLNRSKANQKMKELKNRMTSTRDEKIEKFLMTHRHKVTSEKQKRILEADVFTLSNMIKERKASCEEVFITYAIRVGTVARSLNLIADVDFERAYKLAIEADMAILEGKEVGVLHGIPFGIFGGLEVNCLKSINKEQLDLNSKSNFTLNANTYLEDNLIVSIFRSQGAIPFITSNSPFLEHSACIWGLAKNPWNIFKSPGSSEAALVASRCVPFALGLDILGSMRLSCAFSGVYGFKQTSSRQGGSFPTFSSFPMLSNSSIGPICRSMDDLIYLSQSLFSQYKSDPYVNNSPFDVYTFTKIIDNAGSTNPVKIAYFKEIKDLPTAIVIKDSVDSLIHNLRTVGYQCVEFPLDKFEEFIQVGLSLMHNSNLFKYILKELHGNDLSLYCENLDYLTDNDNSGLYIMNNYRATFSSERQAKIQSRITTMTKEDYIEANVKFYKLKRQFIDYWRENSFDALISPLFPTTALEPSDIKYFNNFNHMTYLNNWTDLPTVVVPLRLSNNSIYTDTYNDFYSNLVTKNMKNSEGLPIAIQIGTLPNQDELVLRLAKEIDYFYRFDLTLEEEMLKKYPAPVEVVKEIKVTEKTLPSKGKVKEVEVNVKTNERQEKVTYTMERNR